MLQTPAAIRNVYSELRKMLGSTASAIDLLNFATVIVRFFILKTTPEKVYEVERGDELDAQWKNFEELPVDIAMRDGGWKILEYEFQLIRAANMEFGEIEISGLHANYLDPYCFAPGDKIYAESLAWLNVHIRQDRVAIEFVKNVNLESWDGDDE